MGLPFTGTCDDLKSWGVLSEDCHNRLSALALSEMVKTFTVLTLSEVGEDPCGLKSSATSHGLCGLLGRVPQSPRRCGAKTEGNKRQRDSFFFGFFLLAKQKKETRESRESDYINNLNTIKNISVSRR